MCADVVNVIVFHQKGASNCSGAAFADRTVAIANALIRLYICASKCAYKRITSETYNITAKGIHQIDKIANKMIRNLA